MMSNGTSSALSTRTHFSFRVDTWTPDSESIVEHTRRFALELLLPFAIAFAAMFTLQITGACAGEVTICSQHYGSVYNKHDKSDWVYRVVDGKKCWFPANGMKRGSEKPLDELRWPSSETAPPVSIPTDSDPAKMQAPWDMEHRWQGDKQ
jgi:hypothetical protein